MTRKPSHDTLGIVERQLVTIVSEQPIIPKRVLDP
jgi:hypothetical protein